MRGSDSSSFVTRSALKVLSGTLLSRVTGLFRDMSMAFFFGATAPLASFLLVYRFVYLLRRLFGESLLHQGFIPHFEKHRREDPKQAALFFRDLFWTLTLVLTVLALLGEWALAGVSSELSRLAMWMVPGVVFLCLFGLTSGLLHSERSFFVPAASPAAFNIVWIFGVIAFSKWPITQAILALSLLLSIAFFLQFALTLPGVWRFISEHLCFREIFQMRPFSKQLQGLFRPLLLGVVGVAAVQVNSAIDGVFARFASLEGPAYLWYAIRMQQLPLALFGLALSSALLPSLSRAWEGGDQVGFEHLIHSSLNKLYLLIVPCVIGIFVLGASSVNLLFGRGDFNELATLETTLCLFGYGVGLLPMALTQILAPAFYAQKDYRTPARAFMASSALNIALNSLLVFGLKWGAASIALSTSLAALCNVYFLRKFLTHSFPMKYALSVLLAGAITAAFGYFVLGDGTLSLLTGDSNFARSVPAQILQFGLQALVFFGLVGSLLKLNRLTLNS